MTEFISRVMRGDRQWEYAPEADEALERIFTKYWFRIRGYAVRPFDEPDTD